MRELLEKHFSNKDHQARVWFFTIMLFPVCLCGLWVVFYSVVALYHAGVNMHFGHGSEILLALPVALVVIAVQAFLINKLINTYANRSHL